MVKCKKRTVVKLNDDLLELTDDSKNKPSAQRLSDDDLVDIHVLEDGLESALDNSINKIVNVAYTELTQEFKVNLKVAVLKAIGFDNRWGKWEVDHCNGRASMLTEFLGSHVQDLVRKELDAIKATDLTALIAPHQKSIRDELVREFKSAALRQARDVANETAKQYVKETMVAHLEKMKGSMISKTIDTIMGNESKPSEDED